MPDSQPASQILLREEARKVAKLARLKLTDDELELLTAQLGQILEYVHVLDRLDTDARGTNGPRCRRGERISG